LSENPLQSTGPPGPPLPHFSRGVEALIVIAITMLLLIPCVWQERIQAGDLSSHVYNAWLAGQVTSGALPGLAVAPLWTNVLSDWALERLLYTNGPVAAERLVTALAVLIFFWGAFFAVDAATGRNAGFEEQRRRIYAEQVAVGSVRAMRGQRLTASRAPAYRSPEWFPARHAHWRPACASARWCAAP